MDWPMMHFGKIADFQSTSSEDKIRIEKTYSSYKSVQSLLDVADSYTALPNGDMQKILEDSLKKAGDGISATFFNKTPANAFFGEHGYTSIRNELAADLASIDLTTVPKYNFDKVTNGNMAKAKIEEFLSSSKGKELGSSLLLEVLKTKHGFQTYLNSKQSWLDKLEKILEDEAYIRGTLIKQLTMEQELCVKMKLYFLKLLGSHQFEAILKKWVSASSAAMMQPVKDFVEKDNLLLFVKGWLLSHPFSSFIHAACFKSHTKSWVTTDPILLPGQFPISTDHTEISYGDAVRSWLDSSNGPKQYGLLISGRKVDNIVKKSHHNKPFGCFIGGTTVLLNDFQSVAIEDLKENSKIIGNNGNVGIVSSEKVVQELADNSAIFGINGSEPFFTSGHPFWTQDGWRAVNPHLAKNDNSWLDVGQLTEGDFVRRIKDVKNGQIDYEWVEIESIHLKEYPAGTKVYGVHLREGPRSYHANGYLVCLNYPEITSQNIVEGMNNLSTAEKNSLQKQLDSLEPILEKVLGGGAAKAMKSITQKHLANSLAKENIGQVKKSLKDINCPHLDLSYDVGEQNLSCYSMPKKMSLLRGHLFLDDKHVPDVHISNGNNISWARDVVDGKWEHGSVKLHGNIQQGHGFVALTQSRNDNKSLLSASFKAAAHVNKYKCYKSEKAVAKPTKTQTTSSVTKWVAFGELETGVNCSSGSCQTVGNICIPPMDTLDDLGHHVIFGVDSKYQLSVTVAVPSDYWSYLGYTKLSGTFSMDYATFSGTCTAYDATKADMQGDEFAWKGILEKNLSTQSMLKYARKASLKSSIHAVVKPAVAMLVEGQSQDAIDGSADNFNNYKCYKSEVSQESSSVTNWVEFGKLEMGVDCSSGSCQTVGKICIPPMDTLDDLGHHVIFSVDSKYQLAVTVAVPSDYWSYLGYTKLSGTFSMDYATFSGTCTAYDATKADMQGDEFAWKGILEESLNTESLLKSAKIASLKSSIHAIVQPTLLMSEPSQSQDAVDGAEEDDQTEDSQPTPMSGTVAEMSESTLNVDELYMITPPDAQSTHELTFSLLQDGMKYVMDSDLLEEIMGSTKPILDADMVNVATTYKDFLGNRFANANLMYALSESSTYETKITDEQRNKLIYFWSGSDEGCLGTDSDYNKCNNAVSRIAYIKSCPDLAKYVDSSEGGPYWAEKLYEKLTEASVLNGLAISDETSNSLTIIQKQTMVLLCLAPDEDYGPDFYRKILMSRLNEMTSYFDGSQDEEEDIKEIFTDSIYQLILKILSGGDDTTAEVTKTLNAELTAAMEELNIATSQTNEDIATDMAAHFGTAISEVVTLFVNKSGTAWDRLLESVADWRKANPGWSGTFKFFSVAICTSLWVCSLCVTLKTFMSWDTLTPEQKVQLIADSTDIVVRSIAGVPDIIENYQTSCENGKLGFDLIKNKIKARMQSTTVDDVQDATVKNVEEIEVVDEAGVDEAIAKATSAQLEDVPEMVSGWQKVFAVTESFAKVTGLIAGVAGCVVVGFQIYRDFSTNASVAQKSLDICQGVTLGVATIAGAVGLMVEAACIPVIGVVCAIIGIALAIASLFVSRDPPKPKPTKVDIYVDGVGGSFVDALTAPSDTWISDYKEENPET